MQIGKSWLILAPNEEPDERRIPLLIKRGAFGSGEHETTASCLEGLEEMGNLKGKRVLDLGCGTGILAIAAAKLGAHPVLAVDTDPDAIKNARENVLLNKVKVEVTLGSLEKAPGSFDLIMANLYSDLLIEMAEEISNKTVPGGMLMLSGILFQNNFSLSKRFKTLGFNKMKERYMEEYISLLLKKGRS